MAVTEETLRTLDQMRARVHLTVDLTTQDLTLAWTRAWTELEAEWESVLLAYAKGETTGRLLSVKKVAAAIKQTRQSLLELQSVLPARVKATMDQLVKETEDFQRRIVGSQLPNAIGSTAQVAVTLNRVDERALQAIILRTTGRVTSLSRPITAYTEQVIRGELARGIAKGSNPAVVARAMTNRVGDAFQLGKTRALVIARTEMLDAHRASAAVSHDAMKDVVSEWQWLCQLDNRVCPSCLSRSGNIYSLETNGPDDHQQGRCTRLPIVKPWKALGFELPEPDSVVPDARAWFDNLPTEQQVRIMGQARLDLLNTGKVSWGDLSSKRSTPGWRSSYAPTSVQDLLAKGAS